MELGIGLCFCFWGLLILAYHERYLRWNLESVRSHRCHSDGPWVRTWQDTLSKVEPNIAIELFSCFAYNRILFVDKTKHTGSLKWNHEGGKISNGSRKRVE